MSVIDTALILAAGVGSRLRPLTDHMPKALVEVAAVPLLQRLLEGCARAGLSRAVVVTGYKHDLLARWLDDCDSGISTTAVFNADYATINNAHSVLVAREALAGAGFVKLDGDLLLPGFELLERLLAQPSASAALIDTSAQLDEEAMKAKLDASSRVLALGKWISLDEAAGESIGVEKIAAGDAELLFNTIELLVHDQKQHDAYYEDAYHHMIEQHGWTLGGCDTSGSIWAEIDDHADLERAEALLEPRRS